MICLENYCICIFNPVQLAANGQVLTLQNGIGARPGPGTDLNLTVSKVKRHKL